MISMSELKTFAVRGINLLALNSTHPSAALVMIIVCPFYFEISRSLDANISISCIRLAIVFGKGLDIG